MNERVPWPVLNITGFLCSFLMLSYLATQGTVYPLFLVMNAILIYFSICLLRNKKTLAQTIHVANNIFQKSFFLFIFSSFYLAFTYLKDKKTSVCNLFTKINTKIINYKKIAEFSWLMIVVFFIISLGTKVRVL